MRKIITSEATTTPKEGHDVKGNFTTHDWLPSKEQRRKILHHVCINFIMLIFVTICSMAWDYISFVYKETYSNPYSIIGMDPYKVLGIEHEDRNAANFTKIIKKSYRSFSLQYHPERNPGNFQAEQKFIQIAAAYDVLTDPDAQYFFERYGHPAGKVYERIWPRYEFDMIPPPPPVILIGTLQRFVLICVGTATLLFAIFLIATGWRSLDLRDHLCDGLFTQNHLLKIVTTVGTVERFMMIIRWFLRGIPYVIKREFRRRFILLTVLAVTGHIVVVALRIVAARMKDLIKRLHIVWSESFPPKTCDVSSNIRYMVVQLFHEYRTKLVDNKDDVKTNEEDEADRLEYVLVDESRTKIKE